MYFERFFNKALPLLLVVSVLVVSFVSFFGGMHLAAAQSVGLSITPAMFEPRENIEPGTERKFSVSVQNLNSTDESYYIFTRNISSVRDGGVPIFATSNTEKTGFEVADWVSLPYEQVLIPAREKVSIEFTVSVPVGASPGSHLGGIFFSVEPPELESSGASVGYQVASILNIRVAGDIVDEANIRQFATSKFLYGSQNVDFSVRIENTGNAVVQPIGMLEVYNMLGNKVGDVVFNEDGASVLPRIILENGRVSNDGLREFEANWQGDSIGFGRYEAILGLSYGSDNAKKTMSSTVTFWVLPMNIIGPALAILAVILLVVFVFVRLYIKRSLAHLSQGRRIVRRRKKGGSSAVLLVVVVTLTVTALFLIVLLALFA